MREIAAAMVRGDAVARHGATSESVMRIAFWGSVAYSALLACSAGTIAATGSSPTEAPASRAAAEVPLAASAKAQDAEVTHTAEVQTPSGKTVALHLVCDPYVLPETDPEEVTVVAEVGLTLIVVDRYMSAPGELSYCQAGEERFLRIISLEHAKPEETLRLKLSSCWQNIEVDEEAGVRWTPESSTLRINWQSGPLARSKAETLTFHVEAK